MTNALDDFTREQFEAGGKTRDIYRLGSGPAVIVIAEIPGITPKVADFGRKVAANGCTAVLPHLFGHPG
ncbi:MAG TPA: dienelactone hydrolase family protein, partial [Acidimicrobiales bacterium]